MNSISSSTSPLFPGESLSRLLQQAAIFGEKRHEVLAGNVANIDTPTYKTRDLDTEGFQTALNAAIEAKRSPSVPVDLATHPYLNPLPDTRALYDPRLARPRDITFQDGNNRSIEHEMVELSKNLMRQTFLLEVMSAQNRQLEAVITERL
jgi:flagellar basal-body rod protein FlgB